MFKPGDRVMAIVEHNDLPYGTTGTIAYLSKSRKYPYSVDFDGQERDYPMQEGELELVNER